MADSDKKDGIEWTEMATAVVLSVAGLFTSWAGYQAALWDGEQAAHYSQANALRTTASRQALEADVRQAVEVGMFNNWLQAKARGEEDLAKFFQARFPKDFRPAFDSWLAAEPLKNPSAPSTPFTTGGYEPKGLSDGKALETRADETYAEGQRDNAVSDDYVRATVFLATGLFFGGICQVFRVKHARLLLLAVSVVACVAGLVQVASLPALKPG
jgi:hypothetical protein